jgi:hypothetical protein
MFYDGCRESEISFFELVSCPRNNMNFAGGQTGATGVRLV